MSGRDDVSITAFTFTEEVDPLWEAIAQDVDKTVVLPTHLDGARQLIAEEHLDVLVYTDIGMDPLTYFLAFARLSPYQCVLGGHPDAVETGNIDAYVSCDLQEPEDAEAHYSVPLVRLPGAPTYYEWPDLPDPLKPREALGLPAPRCDLFLRPDTHKNPPGYGRAVSGILERPDRYACFAGRLYARTRRVTEIAPGAKLRRRRRKMSFLPR